MIGTFVQRPEDPHVALRTTLLEGGHRLPPPPAAAAAPAATGWSDEAAAALDDGLRRDGVAVLRFTEPLPDEEFLAVGAHLGTPAPETDPAVQPYVDRRVILNLVSGRGRTADVSRQPFSTGPLTLHSEGSGRPVAAQPRYIVLSCHEPGGEATAAQTVLVPMAGAWERLPADDRPVLLNTRYRDGVGVPTVARREAGRISFSFRDFDGDALHWRTESPGADEAALDEAALDEAALDEAAVNRAFRNLLAAMYAADGAAGVHWTRGTLVVIDNHVHFHGRTAGVFGPGPRRHLKRLRVLGREREA